jgi:hypothetical protein
MDRSFSIDGMNAGASVDSIQPYVANLWRSYRNLSDGDGDGLLDSWETQHFGGATNANSSALAANGINTIYETYIAGLNPTNTQSVLALSGQQTATQSKLQWSAVSGRVYSVYWTTNLLNGFQPLKTNLVWPQNSWTDAVHGARADGFYKIEVHLGQ